MWVNSQFPAHLVTFTEEILNEKLYFLCSVYSRGTYETSTRKKLWTHENTHEKKSGPMKYPQEKNLDPRNTHEKKLPTYEGTKARWHDGTRSYETYDGTRPTEFTTFYKKEKSWKNLKTIKLYTDKVFSALYLPS